MKAITREEKIISGENLTPITRKEMFLAKAAGQNVTTPTPITREEIFLSKISGGGGSVEGTAIPVGVPVEKIYFNTNLSVEETNAYLSQLTYVQTDMFSYPIYIVGGSVGGDGSLIGMIVLKDIDTTNHFIIQALELNTISGNATYRTLYDNQDIKDVNHYPIFNNGYTYDFAKGINWIVLEGGIYFDIVNKTSLTDLNGIPVGAENEKIKNVLSITPFGASGGSSSNEPTAYTVSSVDELPSNAVDGSMAIVESDNTCYIRENGEWVLMGDGVLVCNGETVNAKTIIKKLVCPNAIEVDENAFSDFTSLTTIDLPNVLRVNRGAFSSCTSLTTIDLPKVTQIIDGAFIGCTSLTTIDLPKVEFIGDNAFSSCTSLTTIDLPKVTIIQLDAFWGCTSLTTIDLPKVTQIVDGAFYGCGSLSTIILRNTETMYGVNLTAILGTKIATEEGMPTGEGFIYVPTSLYEDYVANFTGQATYLLIQTGVPQEEAVIMAEQISRAVLRKIEDYPEICGV